MPKTKKHFKKLFGGSGSCAESGWAWQQNNLGGMGTQFDRVMNSSLGNPATQMSNAINTTHNVNASSNWPTSNNMMGGTTMPTANMPKVSMSSSMPQTKMGMPINTTSKMKGGKRKYKHGGNLGLGLMLKDAVAPGLLLASQNMYKKKDYSKSYNKGYNKSNKKYNIKKRRGGNFLPVLNQAIAPGLLLASQNMFNKKTRKNRISQRRRY
jgi:hypothetical protein